MEEFWPFNSLVNYLINPFEGDRLADELAPPFMSRQQRATNGGWGGQSARFMGWK